MRLVLTAVLALLAVAPVAAAAEQQDPDAFTPVVPTVLAPPWPVEGSDGRTHVVHEVQLLNTTRIPWRVTRVVVRSGAPAGRTLAAWEGPRVGEVWRSMAGSPDAGRLGPGEGALVHLTFSARTRSRIPRSLVHEVHLANLDPDSPAPAQAVVTGARASTVRRAPAVLGPPLRGDRWLAADGCCTAVRHVRATQPFGGGLFTAQRFAIDWERLDADGRLFVGDKRVLTNWAGYGQDVLAVADGTVVRAIDGLPNQVPGALPEGIDPLQADGNAVFLRLADGRVVFYAHMIPGSVTVRAGDRVVRGAVLGKVGNSGNSSAPHLHLHVTDRPAIFAADGLPYVFSSFDVTGRVASTEAFDEAEATGNPVRLGPVRTGPRRNVLPLDQVIVTWP